MKWETPYWNSHEESKDAWKILKHHTEVASSRIYEELPEILQRSFDEGVAYAREQAAREILERLPEYTETEACKRAGFYYDRDDVIDAIARGEK